MCMNNHEERYETLRLGERGLVSCYRRRRGFGAFGGFELGGILGVLGSCSRLWRT